MKNCPRRRHYFLSYLMSYKENDFQFISFKAQKYSSLIEFASNSMFQMVEVKRISNLILTFTILERIFYEGSEY